MDLPLKTRWRTERAERGAERAGARVKGRDTTTPTHPLERVEARMGGRDTTTPALLHPQHMERAAARAGRDTGHMERAETIAGRDTTTHNPSMPEEGKDQMKDQVKDLHQTIMISTNATMKRILK